MEIIRPAQLNESQSQDIRLLLQDCRNYDRIPFSFPKQDDTIFLLLYDNRILLSALSAFFDEENRVWDCFACTAPDHRRKGYFRRLLTQLTEDISYDDIVISINPDSLDARATLDALGTRIWYEDFMMERDLMAENGAAADFGPAAEPGTEADSDLVAAPWQEADSGPVTEADYVDIFYARHRAGPSGLVDDSERLRIRLTVPESPDDWYQFYIDSSLSLATVEEAMEKSDSLCESYPSLWPKHKAIGKFKLDFWEDTVYFYGYEIEEALWDKGLGNACFHLVLQYLCSLPESQRKQKIRLQVSDDNDPACAIYKRFGFHVIETVSHYIFSFD